MASFCKAGLGAGRFDCRIRYRRMALSRNCFLSNDHCVADGAVASFRKAGLCAGRSYRRVCHRCVARRIDRFRFCLMAAAAFSGLNTGFRAGRRCRYRPLAPVVAERRYFFLSCDNRSAHRAMAAFRKTCLCARRCYCSVSYRSMASRLDRSCFCLMAAAAFPGLNAGFCAGRRCRYRPLAPIVAERRYFFLSCDNLSAHRAMAAFRKTCLCTGRCYRRVCHRGVIQFRSRLGRTAQFSAALCAIDDFVVAALCRAGGCYFVFNHWFSSFMITINDRDSLNEQSYICTAA